MQVPLGAWAAISGAWVQTSPARSAPTPEPSGRESVTVGLTVGVLTNQPAPPSGPAGLDGSEVVGSSSSTRKVRHRCVSVLPAWSRADQQISVVPGSSRTGTGSCGLKGAWSTAGPPLCD